MNANGGNFLVLRPRKSAPLVYELSGFVEGWIDEAKAAPSQRVTLNVFNVQAKLVGKQSAPRVLHLGLVPFTRPTTRFRNSTGQASIKVPVQLTYPELGAGRRIKSAFDVVRHSVPLRTELLLTIQHLHLERGFVAVGFTKFPRFTPIASTAVRASLIFACTCFRGSKCLEVCLSVKVASYGGTQVITQQEIQQCVADANASFGCGPGGQCCIRFRLEPVTPLATPPVPRTLTRADLEALRQRERASKCYNVYIIDQLDPGINAFGLTYTDGDTASVVQTNGRTPAEYSSTFRHELGHALGLAPEESDDPRGVDGHSPRGDNVMAPSANPAPDADRVRLNARQCEKARNSGLVTDVKEDCNGTPREF